MSTLDIGYLVGVIPCLVAAACLPIVWFKPAVMGPILLWLVFMGFAASIIIMSGVLR